MLPREPSYNTQTIKPLSAGWKQQWGENGLYNHHKTVTYIQCSVHTTLNRPGLGLWKLLQIDSYQPPWMWLWCVLVYWPESLYSQSGEISFPSACLPGIVWHTETWPLSFTHWRPRGQSIISRSASSSPKKFPQIFLTHWNFSQLCHPYKHDALYI